MSLPRRAREKLHASLQATARQPGACPRSSASPSPHALSTGPAHRRVRVCPGAPHLRGLQVASRHAPCSGKHEGPVCPHPAKGTGLFVPSVSLLSPAVQEAPRRCQKVSRASDRACPTCPHTYRLPNAPFPASRHPVWRSPGRQFGKDRPLPSSGRDRCVRKGQ